MKISELKQPYRRMAEYLAEKSTEECYHGKKDLDVAFDWYQTNIKFWSDIDDGDYPPITEEIKKHFPPDFDFSVEDEYPNNQCDEACYYHCTEGGNINPKCINERYTKLAKEGKFDRLPDTCEFSEPVELLVWDNVEPIKMNDSDLRLVSGKFRGVFIAQNRYASNKYFIWQYAKLPIPKIDFSQFKTGDVVEVELSNEEKRIGWFDYADRNQVVIKTLQRKGNQVCNGGSCSGSKMFNLEKIKLITKIK